MDIVDKVIERIENRRSREKPRDRKREEEVWEMENWLIGTGNVRKRKKTKSNAQM